MTKAEGKVKLTSVRLSDKARGLLDQMTHVLGKSQREIFEEALEEYAEKRGITSSGYQLHVAENFLVLTRADKDQTRVVAATAKNGVPPEEVAAKYAAQLKEPVRVVDDNQEKRPS